MRSASRIASDARPARRTGEQRALASHHLLLYAQVRHLPQPGREHDFYSDLADKLRRGSPRSQVVTLHHFHAVHRDVQRGGPLGTVEGCLQREFCVRVRDPCLQSAVPLSAIRTPEVLQSPRTSDLLRKLATLMARP